MTTRVYLKQRRDGAQRVFVAISSEVFKGERYFDGYQTSKNGSWVEWDMTEKNMNRMIRKGRMVRIQ